jgi:hypothetical protein
MELYINGPTFDSNGYLNFDGVDDFINCGNPSSFNIGTSGSLTITATYQRLNSAITNLRLLAKGGGSDAEANIGFAFFGSDTAMSLIISDFPNARKGISIVSLSPNRWYNITGVIDKSINTVSLYLNGEFKTSRSDLSPNATLSGASELLIGANIPGSVLFKGLVANVQRNSKALTAAEILQNYYQAPIVTDGLVYALDASNLVSYERGATTSYPLTGSNTGYLWYGTEFTSNTGGTFNFGTTRICTGPSSKWL